LSDNVRAGSLDGFCCKGSPDAKFNKRIHGCALASASAPSAENGASFAFQHARELLHSAWIALSGGIHDAQHRIGP
jgi:hypothetical protein